MCKQARSKAVLSSVLLGWRDLRTTSKNMLSGFVLLGVQAT